MKKILLCLGASYVVLSVLALYYVLSVQEKGFTAFDRYPKNKTITSLQFVADSHEPKAFTESLHNVHYSTTRSNHFESTFVVPRRAYYYNRGTRVDLADAIVVITEIHKNASNSIVSCEINGTLSTRTKTLTSDIHNSWVLRRIPGSTHLLVLVQCFGFPKHLTTSGSIVNLIYKRDGKAYHSRVETEKPLVFVNGSSTPTRGSRSIVVCSAVFDHPERLEEWLKYQHTLGVDSIHLNVDASFYKNAVNIYPLLRKFLDSGFVRMEVWKDIVGSGMFYHGQIVKYHDCLYRYIGIFKYGLFIDVDDFFNPMLPHHKDIHYYFKKAFYNNKIGTVAFPWRKMMCKPNKEKVEKLRDGNLTSLVSGVEYQWMNEMKAAHSLYAVQILTIHGKEKLLPGYRVSVCRKKMAYIAHNKVQYMPC